jgi:hypothetical protein
MNVKVIFRVSGFPVRLIGAGWGRLSLGEHFNREGR